MPVPSALVGTAVTGEPVRIDTRWTMAFAAGVGDPAACYLDTTRPGGVAVHPVFACGPEWPALRALRDATAEFEAPGEGRRRVHWTHDTHWHAPLVPDTDVVVTATVAAVFRHRAGAAQLTRLDAVDATAETPYWTTWLGTITRGATVDGPDVVGDVPAAPPIWPDADAAVAVRHRAVDAGAAHVFTECARIWNPIHTDLVTARSAGLDGLILHGTATLAIGVTETLRAHAMTEPAQVRRVRARMRAMVPMPSRLRIECAAPVSGADGMVLLAFRVLVADRETSPVAAGDAGWRVAVGEASLAVGPGPKTTTGPGLEEPGPAVR